MYLGVACGCWTWSFLNTIHPYLVPRLFTSSSLIFFNLKKKIVKDMALTHGTCDVCIHFISVMMANLGR